MKLLLTTIKTDCKYTDYAMRYLYSVVADSPLEVDMKTNGKYELDGHIYGIVIVVDYDLIVVPVSESRDILEIELILVY